MAGAARIGDIVGNGGAIITGCFTVLTNDRPSAQIGSVVTPHPPCPENPLCCAAIVISASTNVIVGDIPFSRGGDNASCGDTIKTSSGTVRVN